MGKTMAAATQGNYIEFMIGIIPAMVMVVTGFPSAVRAWALGRLREIAASDCVRDCIVRAASKWIFSVPCLRRLSESVFVSAFVSVFVSVSVSFAILLAASRVALVIEFVAALKAMRSAPVLVSLVFREFIQRLHLIALRAAFCFHKNASCQHGVNACV